MNWKQPGNVWQWLLLLMPSVETILLCLVPLRWASYLLPHDEIPDLTLLIYNLPVAFALSMALGVWIARGSAQYDRLFTGFCFGLLIAITNGMIAFAGCSLVMPHL